MSLHLIATETSTYTFRVAGWQLSLIVAAVVGIVWAVRQWRRGVRPSDYFGKR